MQSLLISYDERLGEGSLTRAPDLADGVWIRIRNAAKGFDAECKVSENEIRLEWGAVLSIIREFSGLQKELGFQFESDDSSKQKIQDFLNEYRLVRRSQNEIKLTISEDEIDARLIERGWDINKRQLKDYQKTNLCKLLAISHGANFSVPGAGKTTVTFALALLTRDADQHLLVVAPKSAFPAWKEVIGECLKDDASPEQLSPFLILDGGAGRVGKLLTQPTPRLLISYEQLVKAYSEIATFISTHKVHLVLDESHRMKSGYGSLRGGSLLNLCHLAIRRDILTGTPMPQSPSDMQSQIDFLWPGVGLGNRIALGEPPRTVLSNLFVRTTKKDLDLPPRVFEHVTVQMADAHKALYCIVRDEFRRQISQFRYKNSFDILNARKSVVRLLQVSTNPLIAIEKMTDITSNQNLPAIFNSVIQEGPSTKILKACELARNLAKSGRKTIIWTIFTDTINRLHRLLPDLNPVVIYGQTPSGSIEDEDTREGKLEQFRNDPNVWVLIANPAAASEGISLHMHCHDAIYLDRSYNATHYLQSIDRIHRLGLPKGITTTIWLIQNQVPQGVGSIDYSVSRRLAFKIREMFKLLEDTDLHELALEEENFELPLEEGINIQDIDDLIQEIEGQAESPPDDELA